MGGRGGGSGRGGGAGGGGGAGASLKSRLNAAKNGIGSTVSNDGKGLTKKLGLDAGSLHHTGNFNFTATIGGKTINISTSPTSDSATRIKINAVTIG